MRREVTVRMRVLVLLLLSVAACDEEQKRELRVIDLRTAAPPPPTAPQPASPSLSLELDVTPPEALSEDTLQNILEQGRPQLLECLTRMPEFPTGKTSIDLTISAKGKVRKVNMGSTHLDTMTQSCLLEAAQGWRFGRLRHGAVTGVLRIETSR